MRSLWLAFPVFWGIETLAIIVLDALLPGLTIEGSPAAALAALLIGLAALAAWPVLLTIAARTHPLLFPVFAFFGNGLLVYIVIAVVPGIAIDNLWSANLVCAALTVGAVAGAAVLHLDDTPTYVRLVVRPFASRFGHVDATDQPGVVFLEIDGLALPVLRQALEAGYMPTLRRWLQSGGYALTEWECDLSSQTSASQAGILLGTNENIPAFRWYERSTGRLLVSNDLRTVPHIERQLSTGHGLLARDGASRGNLFSGDAPDSLLTLSTIRSTDSSPRQHAAEYYSFFLSHPYLAGRTAVLFLGDIATEIIAATFQRLRDEKPRVHRGGIYPIVRAFSTSLLLELCIFAVIGDMRRGVHTVYTTFVGYDEVAHHSGILRRDALRILRRIDRRFELLERVARDTPRPYRLVVLSDHGQSQGTTFRQRYGRTLQQLVEQLVTEAPMAVVVPASATTSSGATAERWGEINGLLTDVARRESVAGKVVRRTTSRRTEEGMVALGPQDVRTQYLPQQGEEESDGAGCANKLLVLGSGNLGLIYVLGRDRRMTVEELNDAYPGLVPGLARHEGIRFLLVRSAEHGALAIGAAGVHYLDEGRIEGQDPLDGFGPHVVHHLRRTDAFPDVADIMVNSLYDARTGEVAAFEELVGSHGGLGGPQTRPFVLHPMALDIGQKPIVGAEQLHAALRRWVAQAQRAQPAQAEREPIREVGPPVAN
jgi:uncharacterized membrane protein YvlD (DUF360 family)